MSNVIQLPNAKGAAQAAPASLGITRVWRYGVRVRGIKKRGRKIDWHSDLDRKGLGESQEYDPGLSDRLAREWISKNMKSWDKAHASAFLWTINHDTGTESWLPFSEAHNKRIELLPGGQNA